MGYPPVPLLHGDGADRDRGQSSSSRSSGPGPVPPESRSGEVSGRSSSGGSGATGPSEYRVLGSRGSISLMPTQVSRRAAGNRAPEARYHSATSRLGTHEKI